MRRARIGVRLALAIWLLSACASGGDLPPDDPTVARTRRPVARSRPVYPPPQVVLAKPPDILLPRPAYLAPVAVPELGTSILRITDAGVFGDNRRIYRHFYSKRQPWNSDESLLLLAFENTAYLLDGHTYGLIRAFTPWAEPVWSNNDPDILYGVGSSPGRFLEYRVSTGAVRVLRSFPEWKQTYLGIGEGNLSNDDRYAALLGDTGRGLEVLVYDLQSDAVVSRRTFEAPVVAGVDIDWVGMSPSGRYVVICFNGRIRAHDLYDSATMQFVRRLTTGNPAHSDLGYDSEGNEVLLTQSDSTAITSIRLDDGRSRQELPAEYMASNQHISCRNIRRPGWCYVSTYSDTWGSDRLMYREIFSLKLDGTGTVERFAQSFSAEMPLADRHYPRQPHAVPDRDGSRVLFASDWGDPLPSAIIDAYVAGVRPAE